MTRSVLSRTILAVLVFVGLLAGAAGAQERTDTPDVLKSIKWQKGPGTAKLRELAEIKMPTGYMFAGGKDVQTLMEMMENPTSGDEIGFLAPADMSWFVVFQFSDVGYVKDDERDKLDADAILSSIKSGNAAANKERRKRGWSTMEIVGWEVSPNYDPKTNNLSWAIRGQSGKDAVINYNTRLLGREGVMEANLVVDPAELKPALAKYQSLLQGYAYTSGHRYAEFRPGDKIAKYGLTALITGGAVAVAAKTGLLKYLWKGLIVVVVAVGAFFKRIFGGRQRA